MEKPGDSDKDIDGLMDGGILHEGSWGDTPPCLVNSEQKMAAFPVGGGGTIYRENWHQVVSSVSRD